METTTVNSTTQVAVRVSTEADSKTISVAIYDFDTNDLIDSDTFEAADTDDYTGQNVALEQASIEAMLKANGLTEGQIVERMFNNESE